MTTPPPPPPPPGPAQPPWTSPSAPGYGNAAREHPEGTTVLVLGIIGLMLCGVLAPFAWVKGNRAKREIDAQPGVIWTNAGSVNGGRVLGIIGTVILFLGVVSFVLGFFALAMRG